MPEKIFKAAAAGKYEYSHMFLPKSNVKPNR
jgi:hypothetical protein